MKKTLLFMMAICVSLLSYAAPRELQQIKSQEAVNVLTLNTRKAPAKQVQSTHRLNKAQTIALSANLSKEGKVRNMARKPQLEGNLDYTLEPEKQAQPVVIELDSYIYSGTYDNGLLVQLSNDLCVVGLEFVTTSQTVPVGTFQINSSLEEGTVTASKGGNDEDDDPSYVWVYDEDGYYAYSYYLISGTVSVAEKNGIYTLNVEAQTYNGSTVLISYEGEMESTQTSTDDDFSKEPAEPTQLDLKLNELVDYTVQTIYSYFDMPNQHNLQITDGENILILELWSDATVLESGTFTIDDTRDDATATASTGYDDDWEEDTGCRLETADGIYYLVSGTVVVEKTGTGYKVSVEALSANGSEIKAVFEGELNPYSFDDEPAKQSDLVIKADSAIFEADDDGIVIEMISGNEYVVYMKLFTSATSIPSGEFEINDSFEPNTVAASLGYDGMYDEPSCIWIYTNGQYAGTFYLESGKVTISENNGVYSITINALSYNETVINVTYEGKINEYQEPEDDPYEYETDEVSVINMVATSLEIRDWYEDYGDYYLILSNTSRQRAVIDLFTTAEGAFGGVFPIDFSEQPGTVWASSGYDEGVYPSYYGTTTEPDEDGTIYLETVYFLVGGNVSITFENDLCKINVVATSAHGSKINISYEEVLSGLELVETADLARVENNTIVVAAQAGETVEIYNLAGQSLYQTLANGETRVAMHNGQILIVRAGNRVAKVVL